MKLLFVINNPTFFISHRLPIALKAIQQGYEVHLASPEGQGVELLINNNIYHHTFPLTRKGINPFKELTSILALFRMFYEIKPDILHLITIKPIIYGGAIAKIVGIKSVVSAVSGLGDMFSSRQRRHTFLRWAIRPFYMFSFWHKNQTIIFQNHSDLDTLMKWCALPKSKCKLILGSGVDMNTYQPSANKIDSPVLLFASRLLKDKGVVEFVEAAYRLIDSGTKAQFWLAGDIDNGNSSTISNSTIQRWKNEGYVKVLGFQDNIPRLLSKASIVVLPSYYGEGLPKILIEAASCGKVVITTDHPGCRDAIISGKTGILVPINDIVSLAQAMQKLIEDPELCSRMGAAGRLFAKDNFSIEQVVAAHMKIYEKLAR